MDRLRSKWTIGAAALAVALGTWLVARGCRKHVAPGPEAFHPEVSSVPIGATAEVPTMRARDDGPTDLASAESGGHVESIAGRWEAEPGWAVIHDGDVGTWWIEARPRFPVETTLSFRGREAADVSEVVLAYPASGLDASTLPDEVRLLVSEATATEGFREAGRGRLAEGEKSLALRLDPPVRARYVRLEVTSGRAQALAIGDVRVTGRFTGRGEVDLLGGERPGRVDCAASRAYPALSLVSGMISEPGGLAQDAAWAAPVDSTGRATIDLTPYRGASALLESVVLDTRLAAGALAGCAPAVVEVRVSDAPEGESFRGAARLEVTPEPGAHLFRVAPEGQAVSCRRVRLILQPIANGRRCALREITLYGRFREAPAPISGREVEPNDAPALASAVAEGETLDGEVGGADDDWVEIAPAAGGSRLEVAAQGVLVDLVGRDGAGRELYALPLGGVGERLVLGRVLAPRNGRLFARLSVPPRDGAAGPLPYRVAVGPAAGEEREPNDRLSCPQRVEVPASGDLELRGTLSHPGDVDAYSFVVGTGDRGTWSFVLEKVEHRDTRFTLAGPDPDAAPGVRASEDAPPVIRVVDDSDHPAREALGDWKPESAGEYFLLVAGGPPTRREDGTYTLVIKRR